MIESIPSTHLKKYILKNKIKLPSSQIDLQKFNRVFLVAIGKSAGTMTEYVSKKIPAWTLIQNKEIKISSSEIRNQRIKLRC